MTWITCLRDYQTMNSLRVRRDYLQSYDWQVFHGTTKSRHGNVLDATLCSFESVPAFENHSFLTGAKILPHIPKKSAKRSPSKFQLKTRCRVEMRLFYSD
jgi:hypothetical protein